MKKQKILAILIAVLTLCSIFSANVSAAETEENLLVYYSFDDSDDLGLDNSGNGHDAQVDGMLTGSEGMVGGAAKFDGSTADLLVEGTGITGLKLFTISAWVKVADADRTGLVSFVSGHNWSNVGAMHCCFDENSSLAVDVDYMWNAWLSSNKSSDTVENGKWTLVTVVFDAEEGWVWTYFNGRMVNEVGFIGGENGVNFNDFTIGGWSNNGTVERFFNGEIDEFKIYGQTFTADEVKEMAGDYYEAPTTESTEEPTDTSAPDTSDDTSDDASANTSDDKTESTGDDSTAANTTKAPETGDDAQSEGGLSTGAIVGIVVAAIVVIAVVVIVVLKKKK